MPSEPIMEAVTANDMARDLEPFGDADVTVKIGGMLVDVYRVTYEEERHKVVLHLHPDDVRDALSALT